LWVEQKWKNGGRRNAVCSRAALVSSRNIKKSESIRRKFMQLQKWHKRIRKLEYKLSVPLKGRNVESEGEMGGVGVASQTGVNLPRLAVAQTHPNPRGSVRSLWLWTVRGKYHRGTNDKSSFLAQLSPPPPHSRTTTFSCPPNQEHCILLITLTETHGSYQGKIHQHFFFTILTAD
jgi:hypothetical protein